MNITHGRAPVEFRCTESIAANDSVIKRSSEG